MMMKHQKNVIVLLLALLTVVALWPAGTVEAASPGINVSELRAPTLEFDNVDSFNSSGRATFTKDGHMGLVDKNGDELIPAVYDDIEWESGDLYCVSTGGIIVGGGSGGGGGGGSGPSNEGLIGFYDVGEGKEILPCEYYISPWRTYYFSGKKVYVLEKEGLQGLYSLADRAFWLDCDYEEVALYSFSGQRVFIAQKDGKYGVLSDKGQIIPFNYEYLDYFDGTRYIAALDGKYGLIYANGNVALPYQYDYMAYCDDGLAVAGIEDEDGMKYGVVNSGGKTILGFDYDSLYSIYSPDGKTILEAEKDGKYGVVDIAGNAIVPFEYDEAYGWYDYIGDEEILYFNVADYSDYDSTFGVYSAGGKLLAEGVYDWPIYFDGGYAEVSKDGKFGIIRYDGTLTVPCEYNSHVIAHYYVDDKLKIEAMLSKNGKYGVLNQDGQVLIPFEYEYMYDYDDGLAIVRKDGLYGVVNKNGTVLPFGYEDITNTWNNMVVAKQDGAYGVIDLAGQPVIPFEYQRIFHRTLSNDVNYFWAQQEDGKWGLLDAGGQELLPFEYESFMGGNIAWIEKDGRFGIIEITAQGTAATVSVTQPDITYGQTPNASSRVSGLPGAALDGYLYTGTLADGNTPYPASSTPPKEAGAYTVTATYKAGDYSARGSASFSILPKTLTLTGLSVNVKTYDGKADADVEGTAVLTGTEYDDVIALDDSDPAAVFENAEVGKNKTVTLTGFVITGDKARNYALPTLKGEIKALSGTDQPLYELPSDSKYADTTLNKPEQNPAVKEGFVAAVGEDATFKKLNANNISYFDLHLTDSADKTVYLTAGDTVTITLPYPNETVAAAKAGNYTFTLLRYDDVSGAVTAVSGDDVTIKPEGITVRLSEEFGFGHFALAWTQVKSSGGGGGGGGGAAQPPATPTTPGVTVSKATLSHISGINRVETSVAISRQGWTSAETVILAPGGQNNLIDALAVAPLAGQEKAPILLSTGSLDPAVVAEIQRLGAKKIYAVGAISQDVIDALKAALPGVEVEVLKGSNRFETATLINSKLTAPQGTFVVGSNAIADAVSAASFAAANGYAIQIAGPDGSVSAAPTGTAYVLGGPTLVSDVAGATRLYGATRYETNKAIRDALTFEYTNIYTADGNTLVDALTGSALAAQTKAAIVLTPGNDPTGVDFGKITTETKVYAFGGAK
ncbi:MAG: WG repeat-containing protein [Gracilibacteraceae bacterium]|jgi:hypothetical protein|nr:WG repeat-containing protein [Gracilibacteraceae bacterium]